jgi:predicted AlkP superfamily pyrophosphatase or phosphodiesterase
MQRMRRSLSLPRVSACLVALLISLAAVSGCCVACDPKKPQAAAPSAAQPPAVLILLSFDGFRWDYDARIPTPNLHRVIARGVRAERLIPSFPSKTFPNHYTIVTGLYPAHHGIVGNSMWDPAMQATFGMSDRVAVADARWWGGEPLWVTVQRQGLIAGIMFWPGSEAPIAGVQPRYWKPYVAPLPSDDARVDQLLAWLDLPATERPSFLTAYFSDADSAGHEFGPDSEELRAAVTKIDGEIGRLIAGLDARGLTDRVNLAMTADHGMAATSPDRVIVVSDYVDLASIRITDINPTLGIVPREGVSVDDLLKKLAAAHPHLHVYRREQTPSHWHYRDNPRIPPIVGVADEGWTVIETRPTDAKRQPGVGGTHGYDPAIRSMQGLFVAAGPAFRRGVVVPPFENVHLYNALAAALHVKPAPNDGDPRIARQLLVTPPAGTQ